MRKPLVYPVSMSIIEIAKTLTVKLEKLGKQDKIHRTSRVIVMIPDTAR